MQRKNSRISTNEAAFSVGREKKAINRGLLEKFITANFIADLFTFIISHLHSHSSSSLRNGRFLQKILANAIAKILRFLLRSCQFLLFTEFFELIYAFLAQGNS